MPVKIAVVTEDFVNISSHFGRAPFYQVFTVQDGKIIQDEHRAKAYHGQVAEPRHDHEHHHNHADMLDPIRDCQVLICGGMGLPAFEKAQEAGLQVVLTGGLMDNAVKAFLEGVLFNDLRRVHRHAGH